ncbi:pyridoxal-phosphate dependent enzyme [Nibrella saemangeumensis]|uniref:Pyridoxal-phosphate dependent enzyme n=1 Tax=Nibrella saemangeumensis TaxID=1084526 RepID=A0ABP8NHP2_9BACT
MLPERESPLQQLSGPATIRLYLKRDDLLHPQVSGNKWRKLKYNLIAARQQQHDTLLTFGGAYSNHLFATAAAGQLAGFSTIGIVRGEDHRERDSPTLAFARSCGMHLHFVSRADYRRKDLSEFITQLASQFGRFYCLPEGGSNHLAVQGVAEVISEIEQQLGRVPDYVCCPVGTGGTLAGLAAGASEPTQVLGFSALKGGGFLTDDVQKLLNAADLAKPFRLLTDYHFGGYAKTTPELIAFILDFEQQTGVLIEQVYTGKMLYGILDLARRGYFPDGATVVAIHTGGLQGRSKALRCPSEPSGDFRE